MLLSTSSSEAADTASPHRALLSFASSLAFALLLMVVATEWLLRAHVVPQDTLAAHQRLLAQADNRDAAFGDSHVARGFDAQAGFVNLAYPSENIDDIIAKVETYFAARVPGRIIMQADPHLFAPYRLNAAQKRPVAPPELQIVSDRHRPRIPAYWQAYLAGGGHLESKVEITAAGSLLSQGDLSQVPARKRLLEARVRSGWHQIGQPEKVADAQARYAAMLDDLTRRGAHLCLVSFPVSAGYSQAVRMAGHQDMIDFFAGQADRVSARYVDARAMIRPLNLFRDVDHLNRAGAQMFSPDLIRACFGGTG